VRVDTGQDPVIALAAQLEIDGLDQARGRHVDQPVPEHVGAQQHLAVPPLEPAQVEPGAAQLEHFSVESAGLLERYEDVPAADRRDQPADHRLISTTEPDDDVGESSDRLAPAVRDRAANQIRQVQDPFTARLRHLYSLPRMGTLCLVGQAEPS
jgi:hypothetical protein